MQTSLALQTHVWQDGGRARPRQKTTQQEMLILPREEAMPKAESRGVEMWSRYAVLH